MIDHQNSLQVIVFMLDGDGEQTFRLELERSTVAVLRRLQEGPATTGDLMRLEWVDRHGNLKRCMSRYGARIDELRRAGHNIPDATKLSDGSSLYVLIPTADVSTWP